MNNLREKFILDQEITFLNHGSYGACPLPVLEEYQKWQRNLEKQPVQFLTNELWGYVKDSRIALSEFVGCDESEIIFFQNPTTAVSNIIHSLRLNPGDEI